MTNFKEVIQNFVCNLPSNAVSLRPAVANEELNRFENYTVIHFLKNPYAGCIEVIAHLNDKGYLNKGKGDIVLDVLDAKGDIIHDFMLSNGGLKWLQSYECPQEMRVTRESLNPNQQEICVDCRFWANNELLLCTVNPSGPINGACLSKERL